jgi:hypothetical protein
MACRNTFMRTFCFRMPAPCAMPQMPYKSQIHHLDRARSKAAYMHGCNTLHVGHFRRPVPRHCAQVASPRSRLVAACMVAKEVVRRGWLGVLMWHHGCMLWQLTHPEEEVADQSTEARV